MTLNNRYTWIGVLTVVNIVLACLVGNAQLHEKSEFLAPSVDDVIVGIRKMEQLLFNDSKSFYIECSRIRCEEITKSRYSGGYFNVRFALGNREKEWYSLKQYLVEGEKNQLGSNVVKLPDKTELSLPREPKTTLVKHNLLLEWDQAGRPLIVVNSFGNGRNIFANTDYFRHLGLNASRHIAESAGVDYIGLTKMEHHKDHLDHPYVPDFLEKNKNKYSVLPMQEAIDGVLCWVVEYPGMDKFWIDTQHGFLIRRRVYHWGPSQSRKFEIHNQNAKEVYPGLWLPQNQVVEKYASIVSESRSIWDKVACKLYYRLDVAQFGDDVPKSIFKIDPEIGTYVMDGIRKMEYTITDPNADPFAGPIGQGIKVNRFVMVRALFIISGSVLILIALWLKIRKK